MDSAKIERWRNRKHKKRVKESITALLPNKKCRLYTNSHLDHKGPTQRKSKENDT